MALKSSGVMIQVLICRMKSSTGCDHCGLRTITLPGQGGNPNRIERTSEGRAEGREIGLRHRRGEDEPIVLIGAYRLLAAPFRAHDHQAAAVANHGGAVISNNLVMSRRLRSEVISAIASIRTRSPASRST